MLDQIVSFLFSMIRISTPIMFVATCAVISERAGLLNMAAESMMLMSALIGVIMSAVTQSLWIGILCGSISSVLVTLFLCFASFVMKVDLYLMSIAMNLALSGATVYIMYMTTGVKSNTAATFASKVMPNISIPIIRDIPILGAILSGHNGFTYIAFLMVLAVWFLLFKTKIGLRIRAVGQNPQAVESIGINPRLIYTLAFCIAAVIASFGGMYLSMGYQSFFIRDITGGRGFIGMSASTIANANPGMAAAVSVVFGLAEAVTNYLKVYIADTHLLSAMPYMIMTVLILLLSAVRRQKQLHLERENKKRLAQHSVLEQERTK